MRAHTLPHHALILACALYTSCLPSTQDEPFIDASPDAPTSSSDMAREDLPPESPCIPKDAALRSPRSISEAMALVEVLPKPLTIACFVTALARPMRVQATRGEISAQPAHGTRSPRVFIFFEPLIMSIALEGEGSYLLEFGELDSEGHSIKGEISFPVTGPLPVDEPYAHVIFNERMTTCAFCHASERVLFEIEGTPVHTSVALRPLDRERVMLEALRLEQLACDSLSEPRRCEILDAIFSGGEVLEGTFPEELPTFY